jgi:hypothetical protein
MRVNSEGDFADFFQLSNIRCLHLEYLEIYQYYLYYTLSCPYDGLSEQCVVVSGDKVI